MDNSRRVPAPDMHRQRVTAQSMVEIVDGPHKSKVGTVAHVKMPHLWVQCSAVHKVRPPPAALRCAPCMHARSAASVDRLSAVNPGLNVRSNPRRAETGPSSMAV